MYLQRKEVLHVFKDCCHYESSCVNDWYKKVRDFSLLIVYIISGCETATQTVSNFNKDLFLEEIENLTDYYKKYFLPKEFTFDKGEYGLKQTVESIVVKNTHEHWSGHVKYDQSALDPLRKPFEYFNWNIRVAQKGVFLFSFMVNTRT